MNQSSVFACTILYCKTMTRIILLYWHKIKKKKTLFYPDVDRVERYEQWATYLTKWFKTATCSILPQWMPAVKSDREKHIRHAPKDLDELRN